MVSNIYEQVLEEVYPHVKTQGRGVLYKVIQIIHREEQSKSQEETQKICDYLDVKPNANKKEDLKKIDMFLIESTENYHPSLSKGKDILQLLRDGVTEIGTRIGRTTGAYEMAETTKWIILVACILVVLFFSVYKHLDHKEQQKQRERQKRSAQNRSQQQYSPPPPTPASLCLVVPAKIASTLNTNSRLLNASSVREILENTIYFLCATAAEANSYEQDLEFTEEAILPDSQREVYLRIDINDGGRNLLNKTTRYGLKSNLPDKAQFTLQRRVCLQDLSGLEKFNRV